LTQAASRALLGIAATLMIGTRLGQESQGYYYTFISLLGLQAVLELGLAQILQQFASHEWAQLTMEPGGRLHGDEQALARVSSLGWLALRWYTVAASLLLLLLGAAGCWLFPVQERALWLGPWLGLCVIASLRLPQIPIIAMLEGCEQLVSVYSYRLCESLLTSSTLLISLAWGAGLWSLVLSQTVAFVTGALFLGLWYPRFWRFDRGGADSQELWTREVWPVQWRTALSWISGYLTVSLFTPVLFKLRGPVEAGQMGITCAVALTVQSLVTAWTNVRAPTFGVLIARREYARLDGLFYRVAAGSNLLAVSGALAAWLIIWFLNSQGYPLAQRFLPLEAAALLLAGHTAYSAGLPFSVYLRAHRREPLMVVSLVGSLLIALSTVSTARAWGAQGVAAGYLAISSLLVFPWVTVTWFRCRARWHND